MNEKHAKALRHLVKRALPAAVVVAYEEKKHKPKVVPSGGLGADGNPAKMVVVPVTRFLKDCQREMYQQLKRHHYKGF